MDQLNFETVAAKQVAGLGTDDENVERARVPGGWIVLYDHSQRVKFCPDGTPPDTPQPPGNRDRQQLRVA
jgi:hypothetical protein